MFEQLERKAEALREMVSDPLAQDYLRGYMRGLRRGHFGEQFGTAEEHDTWMSLAPRDDEQSKALGQGYLDGFYRLSMWDESPSPAVLRGFIKAHGYTGAKAAAICGVDARTVRYWQAEGQRNIPLSAWRLLLGYQFCSIV